MSTVVPFLHDYQADGGEVPRPIPLPYSKECWELAQCLLSKAIEGSYSLDEVREMYDLALYSNDARGLLFTEMLICIMECISEKILTSPDRSF